MMYCSFTDSASFLDKRLGRSPEVFLILRHGLSEWAERLSEIITVDWNEIPGLPALHSIGRGLTFTSGNMKGVEVLCLDGRLHYYEGYSMNEVVSPIHLASALGIKVFIFTCGVGLVSDRGKVGDTMIVRDYINLMGVDPTRGVEARKGQDRFTVVSNAFDRGLSNNALGLSRELEIPVFEGVYAAVSGPTFETPAEVNCLRIMGADVVGMSLVPETVTAVREGGRVLAICLVANMAGSDFGGDEEVNRTVEGLTYKVFSLLDGIISRIAEGKV
ncbi:MAG: purine-nucleoside phosphorylase [Candidatus Coatesbacteria bacterium 4484_99]|uniref:purine-nucleoside phosphorylase n=1 Tax=Candidatus Coatesbacteria bacterium 4484_99 TaxID=1970774 RepID=A0A1W9S0I6_9BACT|nr:MAG: purine-nucleoside phosphorylase [Candidatus Coatesbacteria bacterium 4484_99]